MTLLRSVRRYIAFRAALAELTSLDEFTRLDLRLWPSDFHRLASQRADALVGTTIHEGSSGRAKQRRRRCE
jgi:hypothetical protein